MDKDNVIHTFDGMLFNLKQEESPVICDNMGETGGHYVKWNKPVKERQTLHESTYLRYLKQSDS